jgi:hypothetical protein
MFDKGRVVHLFRRCQIYGRCVANCYQLFPITLVIVVDDNGGQMGRAAASYTPWTVRRGASVQSHDHWCYRRHDEAARKKVCTARNSAR